MIVLPLWVFMLIVIAIAAVANNGARAQASDD